MARELLKEAIADAKAVKEAAIANAKAALEEAFTPHLKEMLATKLEAMDSEDAMEGMADEEATGDLSELNLDEILAELEGDEMEEGDEPMNEAKKDESKEDESKEDAKDSKDDELVGDMSEEDLKKLIMSVFDEMGVEPGEGEDLGGEMPADEMTDEELPQDLEEVDLAALLEEYEAEMEEGTHSKEDVGMNEENAYAKELEEMKKELEEAYSTIKTLRGELNETNLLNAKLLYTNKIFKAKNLTESQKVKVLSTFDKATTVKEVKLVFESLNTTLTTMNTAGKAPIKESLGFASKAAGISKNNTTIETDAVIARMKKLAGL